jgi:type I restriction enzyme S subunit
MSFPRYPKYKPSGVEWLGDVPAHWEVKRFKRIFREREERSTSGDELLLSVSAYTGVSPRSDVIDDGDHLSRADSLEGYKLCYKDDLVVNIMLAWNRGLAFTTYQGIVSPAYCVYFVIDGSAPGFLNYLVRSNEYTAYFKAFSSGVIDSRLRIYPETFGRLFCGLPPLPEQTRIAEFLDRETAKIDGLVAEQRRLIELLKEKRQAVISHAVTRGLNPKAPLKPSGIEWLGDVPAHWEVLKGSLIGTLFGSEQVPEESVTDEGDLPFIKVGSMSSDSFTIESWDWFVDRTVASQYHARNNFIVFPKRGAAIFLNKVNIVDRPSLIDPNLMGWEIGNRADASFIAYALKCRKLDELADVSTVPQINNKHIGPERFPVPPLQDQREIVAFLKTELAQLDTLTAEAQRAIDLLQERRTALISAAVTGQIDVRRV